AILEMEPEDRQKAAFIQIKSTDTLSDINADLRILEAKGYKYIFVDEVTLMKDFIEGAALFSDIYAGSGMKLVLSGTDSLGFIFAKSEQLYDRCIMVHTTFIPYREFESVLSIRGIDNYIRYGGTMSVSGINYNQNSTFMTKQSTDEYIDTAIAKNIQHSLRYYQDGGHFRLLYDLYEKGELTSAINRVVEDINHRFAKEVLTRAFSSHDLSVSARNLLRDRSNPVDLYRAIDKDSVTATLKSMLDILDKEEQKVEIDEAHAAQIKEYLSMLDLLMEVELRYLPHVNRRDSITAIAQPGLRYAQATALVSSMLLDETFSALPAAGRSRILERIVSEIQGRMMEEIVLLETKLANPRKEVFKLQFAVGEFDMVIADSKALTCEIFEIKYSQERVPEQCRHLLDKEKCHQAEHRFGAIKGRTVIYRGETTEVDQVKYINVEEYLKQLSET
ncbi:MAG: ATP-binding protein, partial [bacterium]|nr:ATP-binding protein [bacterium]